MKDFLTGDHSELDALLGELFAALDAGDARRIYQKLDLFWARLAMHIRAEHLHLFPAILGAFDSENKASRAFDFEAVQNAIAKQRADHDFFMVELAKAMKRMRGWSEHEPNSSISHSLVRETIVAVRRRLETHNQSEESEIYQWVDILLNPLERENLNERMRKELDNLPPRFGKPGETR